MGESAKRPTIEVGQGHDTTCTNGSRLLIAFYLLPRHEMIDTTARLWHPWLRINRVLRVMLHTRWSADAWSQVRVEFKTAPALRSEIRRAGWFNRSRI